MRILFAGTPGLAVPSLITLAEKHTICGVLTGADRKAGRGLKLLVSPIKSKALELGLTVYQPGKIDEDFRKKIASCKPDILVVVAYGKIFKKSFLDLFPRGGINFHPSLLPRHRGPSPIPASILSGDTATGVTVQKLALKMDSGAILAQEVIPLKGDETSQGLEELVSQIGSRLLVSVLHEYSTGTPAGKPQIEEKATYCHLVRKSDGLIDWNEGAEYIGRMIRAYSHWPGTYTIYRGRRLKLIAGGLAPEELRISREDNKRPGLVLGIDKHYGILIHTGKGILFVKVLKLESKKRMDWRSFLNGQHDFIGYQLGV